MALQYASSSEQTSYVSSVPKLLTKSEASSCAIGAPPLAALPVPFCELGVAFSAGMRRSVSSTTQLWVQKLCKASGKQVTNHALVFS
jgi:hypothetical protein